MESKKLPVLWVDARDPILEDRHEHVISGLVLTTSPYQGNQEPYIPVARVREMIADIKSAAKNMDHPSMNRDCWLCGMVHLQKLIEDVDMGVLRDES